MPESQPPDKTPSQPVPARGDGPRGAGSSPADAVPSAAMRIEIPIEHMYPPVKLGQATAPAPAVKPAAKPASATHRAAPVPTPPAAPPAPSHQLQEIDVWYGGYAGRDMVLGFVLCLAWTVLVILYVGPWVSRLMATKPDAEFWTNLGLIGGAWLFQLFRWSYRKLAYQLRITTRHIILQRGFLYHWEVHPLAQIARIEVRQHPLEKLLRIGRIQLSSATPAANLTVRGVLQPREVAEKIRHRLPSREAAV